MVRMQFPRSLQLINPSLSLSNSLKASLNSVRVNPIRTMLSVMVLDTVPRTPPTRSQQHSGMLGSQRCSSGRCTFPLQIPWRQAGTGGALSSITTSTAAPFPTAVPAQTAESWNGQMVSTPRTMFYSPPAGDGANVISPKIITPTLHSTALLSGGGVYMSCPKVSTPAPFPMMSSAGSG